MANWNFYIQRTQRLSRLQSQIDALLADARVVRRLDKSDAADLGDILLILHDLERVAERIRRARAKSAELANVEKRLTRALVRLGHPRKIQ